MRCPYCKKDEDQVINSRACDDGFGIRRRRKCLACKRRYTTYEKREEISLRVIKKDGSRQPFTPDKIVSGLIKACEKRPVPMEKIKEVLSRIERAIYDKFDREVPSQEVGELIMKELKALDQVAYVRFASVYREFKDARQFMKEIKNIHK
ncbi:MAG TPA: transcriptional regulator NrdR [Planctomycetota bacterium]|nr:transcriptional regulator NrdR [Planctomycetota bacterium]